MSRLGPDRVQVRDRELAQPWRFIVWIRDLMILGLDYLARRPRLTILLTGTLGFVGCLVYALLNGIPQPSVHDEFSYLLAGDTFAAGRVTNPTHPMWQHFETFHVIQQPTYASKYPPGQGLILALGQILGHPILGVWISVALMGAAISWMLYQWMPPRWAAFGSFLALVQVGIPTYWAQSYWGGALAALGGALVYGSVRACATVPRLRHGILFGLGAMILANTRPLEGMLVGLPAALTLGRLVVRTYPESRAKLLRRVIAPVTLLLLATVGATGFYNWEVTGDPLRLPYREYNQAYHFGAPFPWQDPSPIVEYRHQVISDFKRVWGIERRQQQREHFLGFLILKFLKLQSFFLGPGLIALVMTPSMIRESGILPAVIGCGLVVGVVFLTLGAYPHYAAPATGLILFLALEGLRHLNNVRTNRINGRRLATLILLAYPPYLVLRAPYTSEATLAFGDLRHETLESLKATNGDDLVIVRYGPEHSFHREWVYNRAEIDSADVVWARDMSPAENDELIRYFDGRRVWLLEVNGSSRLRPYRMGRS